MILAYAGVSSPDSIPRARRVRNPSAGCTARAVLGTLAGPAAFGLGGIWASRVGAWIPNFELRFFGVRAADLNQSQCSAAIGWPHGVRVAEVMAYKKIL
jgi:hypothetical protein